MDHSKETMILTFGSERIIIEKNDLCSDDSDTSDCSSCLSYSDYEEIEIGPSLNVEKERKTLPNPYVKLVRCDHLVGKVSSGTNLKRTEHKTTRSSPRVRRPNGVYLSDEFQLYDFSNIKHGKRKFKKKREFGNLNSSSNNPDELDEFQLYDFSNMKQRKRKFSIRKKKREVGDFKSSSNKPDDTKITNGIINFRTDLAKHVKKEYLNNDNFEYNDNANVNGMTSNPNVIGRDILEDLPISAIKEEPRDDYFDCMSEGNFKFSRTSYNRPVYPVFFPNKHIKTFIKQEVDYSTELSEIDHFNYMNYKPMVNGDLTDMDSESVFKQENKQSSDSEVDVEKDWEGPLFSSDPSTVAFDHSYAIQFGNTHPIGLIRNIGSTPKQKIIIRTKTKQKTTLLKKEKTIHINEENPESKMSRKSLESLAKHNTLERARRASLKESFSGLRDEIPELHGNKWASKQAILDRAVLLIKSLENEEISLVQLLNDQTERREKLTERLKKY